jgi:hypothetical protein
MAMCGRPEGNGGGRRRPGVVVGSSRCEEVVLTEERLERALRGSTHRAGRSGGEGPEGLWGLELEGL